MGRLSRSSASEKYELIRLVEESKLPIKRTLSEIGLPRSTFYRWYAISVRAWLGLRISPRSRASSGIASQSLFGSKWCRLLWSGQNTHHVNWLGISPTLKAISSLNRVSIAFSSALTSLPVLPLSWSKLPQNTSNPPNGSMRCGKPTSASFASKAEVTTTSRRCWMTIHATSSPGNSVQP
jgi:hypothetical protein